MKAKRTLALLLSAAMVLGMTSFVYADDEPYVPQVVEANIKDYDGEVGNTPYDEYEVAEEDGVVTVTMENLEKHTSDGQGEGYWAGFAVVAPDGATQFTYSFDTTDAAIGTTLYPVEDIYSDGSVYGVAFYTDADAVAPKTYAKVQWYDGAGEPVTDVVAFEMVLDVDFAYPVDDYEAEIVAANIKDCDGEVGNTPYDEYEVAEEDGVVTVTMENLEKHTSDGQGEGYWAGFAVVAPDGATQFTYSFDTTDAAIGTTLYPVEDIYGDGSVYGVAFYTDADAVAPKTYAKVQWYDAYGEYVTEEAAFEMVLDVDFAYPVDDYEAEIVEANIKDYDGEVGNTPYDEYAVAEEDGVVTVTMENLAKHTSDGQGEGYWAGFAVVAPDGATQFTYSFDTTDAVIGTTLYPVEDIYGDGSVYGVAFYTDAINPKTYAKLQWYDAYGEYVTEEVAFEMVLDVTYEGAVDITVDDVTEAIIEDSDDVDAKVYSSYKVAATERDGAIKVAVSNRGLKKHTNGSSVEGYWTGFAVKAPADAEYAKYTFGDSAGIVALEDIDQLGTMGIAFYTDAADATTEITLQWLDVNNDPISNVATFKMNLSDVFKYGDDAWDSSSPSGVGGIGQYIVTFNTNGGSAISSVNVKKNATVTEPAAPVKEGFVFDGWYTDAQLTAKYDFAAPVTKSFTLFAKWIEATEDSEDTGMPFADVTEGDWFFEAVSFVYENGITNGMSETEYAPQGTVTRAQFITMLCRAYGIEEMEGDNFADAGDTWYTGYLAAAKQLGISSGVGDNMFAPEKEITREEMVTLIYNYIKTTEDVTVENATEFADADEISDWAKDAVSFASSKGYVQGKGDNKFDPKGTATRAELAQIFYNIFK